MASYNNNEDAPHEPDGVALIWNMKYQKESPEYIFNCQVKHVYSVVTVKVLRVHRRCSCLLYLFELDLYIYVSHLDLSAKAQP